MGVLQRFERRLGGLVEGAFARVFKGQVEPVEVAAALQREAADKKAIVGAGRILVPNEYVVELGPSDAERLLPYAEPLGAEFAAMVREHAEEQGWSFVGPVVVTLEESDRLETGMFEVRSAVVSPDGAAAPAAEARPSAAARPPAGAAPDATQVTAPAGPRAPQLLVTDGATERTVDLTRPVTLIGRSAEADVRIADTGVSRKHAEVRREGGGAVLVDLGSTNGSRVNGRPVQRADLRDGDRIQLGPVSLIFSSGGD